MDLNTRRGYPRDAKLRLLIAARCRRQWGKGEEASICILVYHVLLAVVQSEPSLAQDLIIVSVSRKLNTPIPYP
jgi:hypothetical protein